MSSEGNTWRPWIIGLSGTVIVIVAGVGTGILQLSNIITRFETVEEEFNALKSSPPGQVSEVIPRIKTNEENIAELVRRLEASVDAGGLSGVAQKFVDIERRLPNDPDWENKISDYTGYLNERIDRLGGQLVILNNRFDEAPINLGPNIRSRQIESGVVSAMKCNTDRPDARMWATHENWKDIGSVNFQSCKVKFTRDFESNPAIFISTSGYFSFRKEFVGYFVAVEENTISTKGFEFVVAVFGQDEWEDNILLKELTVQWMAYEM